MTITIIKSGTYQTSQPVEVNEFKKSLIAWCENQATGQRTQAAIANRKYVTDKHCAKAETYDMIVLYLKGLEIKE